MFIKGHFHSILQSSSFSLFKQLKPICWGLAALFVLLPLQSCKDEEPKPNAPSPISFFRFTVNQKSGYDRMPGVPVNSNFTLYYTNSVDTTSAKESIQIKDKGYDPIAIKFEFLQGDSAVKLIPVAPLKYMNGYTITQLATLKAKSGAQLGKYTSRLISTEIDTSQKLPTISDDLLLDSIQYRTFQYFWDFGHPVSGLARERNTSGDLVTSGGAGMGSMSIIAGVNRGFVTREQALSRMLTISDFLLNKAERFHGAYPHWLSGSTGKVIPFSTNDNGGDLVETSYLIQGLLAARAYFNNSSADEIQLRNQITQIWESVEWDWYTRNNSGVLYWHWSPSVGWAMNMPIRGWNECLITYILAASSPTHGIDAPTYQKGWANNGSMKNGNNYYGFNLPLGESNGGPLFFSHYSFLGIDPRGLTDQFANYETQVVNHSKINHAYCKANPRNYYGYSANCWGLTASDNHQGYAAHSPNNDLGVISPTAALSSMPYTPTESMNAARFFYYKLGDRIWKQYGFTDAFTISQGWFASSFLAIDQGPIVVMIENYRSQLLWNLVTSDPEIVAGMKLLGFSAPYL